MGCLKALGAKTAVVTISIIVPTVKQKQMRRTKKDERKDSRFLVSKAVLLGLFALCYLGLSRENSLDIEDVRGTAYDSLALEV